MVHEDLQHHASGCYAAHSGVKRWNRTAENRLLAAEKFSALAEWITGQPYPADFDRAWKNVLFNQFHDILAGTSLEAAYDDARDQFGEALAIADRALNSAIQSLAWKINIEPEAGLVPMVVFNPHAWQVQANVEVESQRDHRRTRCCWMTRTGQVAFQFVQSQATAGRQRLSFVADLPPLGYRRIPAGDPPGARRLSKPSRPARPCWKTRASAWSSTPRPATSPACAIKPERPGGVHRRRGRAGGDRRPQRHLEPQRVSPSTR